MRSKYILAVVVLLTLAFGAGRLSAAGGTLDSSGPPDSTYSYTVEDIYNRLDAGTDGAQSTFTEPASGPTVGTGNTLNEIMALAPAVDDTFGATQTHVLTGGTVWGLTSGQWGVITGTMTDNDMVTITPTTTNQTIAAGYHDGSGYVQGDADLAAGNIRSGANIFGIAGDSNVVNTSSGDATADEILQGKRAWVDGVEIVGSGVITPGDPAPVPKTGQTISYTIGDDGDLEMGVAWPNPRFITSTTGIVTDTLTGLIWLKDANCIQTQYPGFDNDATTGDGRVYWQHALDFVAGINSGTYSNCGASFTDWRLPNVKELHSLVHYGVYDPAVPNTAGTGKWTSGDPFTGVQSNPYWSSTTVADDTSRTWVVLMVDGNIYDDVKITTGRVWPVRGG